MKKLKNKQGRRASREMKAKNSVTVKNAAGQADSVAKVISHNKINFTPKISVIVPVYNTEKYLKQCLDSILNQTFKEIEVICVDDGSKDKSLNILKDYASKDDRITVLSQNNLYAGVARNAGIAVAKGEYLCFLDSDDFFELDMLEKAYNRSIKDDSDIVIFGHFAYDNKTKENINKVVLNEKYIKASPISPLKYQNQIFTCCNPNPWNKLSKRKLFIDNNLRYEGVASCNDMTCVCALLTVAEKISFMKECFVHYRINTGTSISSARAGKIDNFLYSADKLEKSLHNLNKTGNYYIAFVDRIQKSLAWETKTFTDEQKEKVKNQAKSILSANLYNELYGTKLSVIIPVYNTEAYLRQCLDSIINQTLKEIEIICVDDGSTDNSLSILREYEKKDKRITVLTQKNQRQGAARNNALKIATGKYVQFLDSDDYLSLDACEKIYNKCEKYQLDMLSFAGINFNNETGETMKSDYYNFKWLPSNLSDDIVFCNWRQYMPYMAVSAALTVYRKNFILAQSITFPERIFFEDNLFFVKAILNAQKFSIIQEVLYFRRVHSQSTTQNWDKNYGDFQKIADMVLSYVKSNNPSFLSRYIKHYFSLCIQGYNCLNNKNKIKYEKDLRKLLLKYNFPDFMVRYHKSFMGWCLRLSHLPFYLYYSYKKFLLFCDKMVLSEKVMRTYRIDIKNYGSKVNSLEIKSDNIRVTEPKWNTDAKGVGKMMQGCDIKNVAHIKVIKDGKLRISFRGPDMRCNNKRFPIYIDYKSIKINGEQILKSLISVWHDKPYVYEKNVKDGDELLLEFEQKYHNYSSAELKDIVIKLNSIDESSQLNLL